MKLGIRVAVAEKVFKVRGRGRGIARLRKCRINAHVM